MQATTQWQRCETAITVDYPEQVDTAVTIAVLLLNGEQAIDQIWFDGIRLELPGPEGIE